MTENIKQAYKEFIESKINNMDYSDIDSFCSDFDIEDNDEIQELLELQFEVNVI